MKRALTIATVLVAAAAFPLAAQAGGSRMPAGGNLMSSYVNHPNHDPRSLWSQQNGTGQILGAPKFSENAGAHMKRKPAQRPHWASGSSRYR